MLGWKGVTDAEDGVLHIEVDCLVSKLWKIGQIYQTYFNQFRNLNHQPNMFELEAFDNVWQPDCVVLPTILLHNCSHSDLNCFQVESPAKHGLSAMGQTMGQDCCCFRHKADAGVLDPILISHIMLRLILIVG